MPSSIGIRIYRIKLHEDHNREPLPFEGAHGLNPFEFLTNFVAKKSDITDRSEFQRTWFFERIASANSRVIEGWIHYGSYGFESKLVDVVNRETRYLRKSTDLEQIPLYFRFWIPSGKRFGLAAFQSFQGRSCVSLVIGDIVKDFNDNNNRYRLLFSKLMPSDLRASRYFDSPVKEFTLIKKIMPPDKADMYLHGSTLDEVEYELKIKAKPRKTLGQLRDFFKETKEEQLSLLCVDGTVFDESKAVVSIAGRRRTVGIFGINSDAGVIDITDSIKLKEGQPEFQSISSEVGLLMEDFHKALSNKH